MVESKEGKELGVLEKERMELEELKQKLNDYEELQKIRKQKEEVKAKIKEVGRKPSVFSGWGKRFAKNMDDDPFGLEKFR